MSEVVFTRQAPPLINPVAGKSSIYIRLDGVACLRNEFGEDSEFLDVAHVEDPGVRGIKLSKNLTFSGTGQRILGDFSNPVLANRVMFQSSTLDGTTGVCAIPNGTNKTAALAACSSSDPGNASILSLNADAATGWALIDATKTGTGAYLPLVFAAGGAERFRLSATANRILADFTTTPAKNRLCFQTTAVNATSTVTVLPTGTGGGSSWMSVQGSDLDNTAFMNIGAYGGFNQITCGKFGTGTTLPLMFSVDGERFRLPATENRFQANFTGAPFKNQLQFQTLTANAETSLCVIPNGTSRVSSVIAFDAVDSDNASYLQMGIYGGAARLVSGKLGTGTFQPLYIATANAAAFQLSATENRFQADFSNGGGARLMFQTSIPNSNTLVNLMPSGSATMSCFIATNSSDPNNCSYLQLGSDSVRTFVLSGQGGSTPAKTLELWAYGFARYIIGQNANDIIGSVTVRPWAPGSGAPITEGGDIGLWNKENTGIQALLDISGDNSLRCITVNADGAHALLGTAHSGSTGTVILQTAGQTRLQANAYGNIGLFGAGPPGGAFGSAAKFLAIGDGDTGIGWRGDGSLSFWANSVENFGYNASSDGIDVYGNGEGGEVRIWTTSRNTYGLLDYYTPTGRVRLLNGPNGIQILNNGTLDQFTMNDNPGGGNDGKCIMFSANGFTDGARLYCTHVAGNWVGLSVAAQNAGKWWSFRGDGNAYSQGTWVDASDIRFKRNVEKISNALDKLDKINGYTYERTDLDDEEFSYNPRRVGVVAQEIQEVLPDAVFEIDEETLGVSPMAVIGLLVQAVKELKARVIDLEEVV